MWITSMAQTGNRSTVGRLPKICLLPAGPLFQKRQSGGNTSNPPPALFGIPLPMVLRHVVAERTVPGQRVKGLYL